MASHYLVNKSELKLNHVVSHLFKNKERYYITVSLFYFLKKKGILLCCEGNFHLKGVQLELFNWNFIIHSNTSISLVTPNKKDLAIKIVVKLCLSMVFESSFCEVGKQKAYHVNSGNIRGFFHVCCETT